MAWLDLQTNESVFRGLIARRLETFGSELVRQGLVSREALTAGADLGGPDLLVRECFWTRFGAERGEIDVYLPRFRVAIEAKVYRGYRINFEEAIGQAMRDLTSILVGFAYIAVPTETVPPWVSEACAEAGIGILGLRNHGQIASLRILTLQSPAVR